jgi:FHS family Na+ dependent glucose MFS transporter 1
MNALHFFFGVGAFISPIIIAQAVLMTGGVRWAYWILAFLILPVAVGLSRLPSPAAPGSEDESAASDGDETGVPRTSRSNHRVDVTLAVWIALFFFLYVGAEGSFGGWIATYAKATGLGGSATAAYLTSVFWGALTLGRLLSIPLAARFSPRQVLAGDLMVCLISIFALLIWSGSEVITWIGTFGAGLGMASIFPTTISLAERHTTITGTVTSWFFVGGSLGGMTIPWAIGQLFESVGPRVTVFAIIAAVVLDAVIFAFIVTHTRRGERAEKGV